MRQVHWAVALLAGACAAQADVCYEEEVVHSGVGPGKSGARRTVYQVCIQGSKQRVSADIETSERMAKVLVSQGKSLRSTTILRLDQGRLYDIDRTALTVRQEPLPAAKPSAAGAAEDTPDREISFRTRSLPDSTEIAGILCRRVAVEMTARHFRPGTREVTRRNRYLYQAWMAEGFPGYEEIASFLRLQESRTSLAPLAFGGGLGEGLEDPGLEQELEALEGFPMSSRLDVFTAAGSGAEKQLLRLSRKVLRLSHEALPDSLFQPSAQLTRLR